MIDEFWFSDVINNQENKTMFEEKEVDLKKKYDEIEERYGQKKDELEKYRRIKQSI